MRKLGIALGVAVALGGASSVANAAGIGVIDWQEALMSTSAAKQSVNQLKSQLGNKPQQVQSLGQEVQQLQQRLQRDGSTMSESERNGLIKQLQTKGQQFQEQRAEVEQARQQKEQGFLKQARPRLDKAIQSVAKRHNLDMIIDRSAVIYGDDAMDLTKEVTAAYNSGK
ncbi:OmpH family outer membrane protein [Carnimonas bestiolae]|uniref:OmpH family outer membrane protein n=1 Tax=Carnimonas bestiolae TaxID=3402172 RepID=UPI003EDC1777